MMDSGQLAMMLQTRASLQGGRSIHALMGLHFKWWGRDGSGDIRSILVLEGSTIFLSRLRNVFRTVRPKFLTMILDAQTKDRFDV